MTREHSAPCDEVPTYLDVIGDELPRCEDCGAFMWDEPDGEPPDHTDPDAEFHNSNFYDITSRR